MKKLAAACASVVMAAACALPMAHAAYPISDELLWEIAARYQVDFEALSQASRALDAQLATPDEPNLPKLPGEASELPAVPDTNAPSIPDSVTPEVPVVPDTPVIPETTPEQDTIPEYTPEQSLSYPVSSVSAYEAEVVRLVNAERTSRGLSPLSLNAALSDVARAKSRDMAENNYFNHTSPTYGSPYAMMKSFGITYRTAGENIAYGYATPEAVVEAWMNSEGHRANILKPGYTQIGVGYVTDGNHWTQMFIS